MKRLLKLIIVAMVLAYSLTAFAAPQEEISSIDALDKGVADTGETHFTKTDMELTECTLPYTVAGYDSTVESMVTKLMFLIGHGHSKAEIIELMNTSIAGEITIG